MGRGQDREASFLNQAFVNNMGGGDQLLHCQHCAKNKECWLYTANRENNDISRRFTKSISNKARTYIVPKFIRPFCLVKSRSIPATRSRFALDKRKHERDNFNNKFSNYETKKQGAYVSDQATKLGISARGSLQPDVFFFFSGTTLSSCATNVLIESI